MNPWDGSEDVYSRLARWFQVLASPMWLRIIGELRPGPSDVDELHLTPGGSQANISSHLSTLLKRGREGNRCMYHLH